MVKEAYKAGFSNAIEKVAKAIPGGAMTLLESIAQRNAAKIGKSVSKAPATIKRVTASAEPKILDYSKINLQSQHRPALTPEPKLDWNLLK